MYNFNHYLDTTNLLLNYNKNGFKYGFSNAKIIDPNITKMKHVLRGGGRLGLGGAMAPPFFF